MQRELDLFGVYIPPLLVCAVAAWLLGALLSRLLIRVGFYRFVWHRPLFDVAMYTIVLGGTLLAFAAMRSAFGGAGA